MIRLENLARRFDDVKDDYYQGLATISKNETVTNGQFVLQAEEELKRLSGRKYAALVHSGSHAISIALLSHVEKGAEIIIPNYSCPPTLSAVVMAGYTPRFVDINEYGSMDTSTIESHITEKTKAILATGLYGDVHDHAEVKRICESHNLVYINDAAQSQFALYKGINSLALGDVVCAGFAENKPLPTLGTFGAVLTDSHENYQIIRALRKNGKPTRMEQYSRAGYNSYPEEQKAMQLLVAIKNFDKWQARRKEIAQMYNNAFKDTAIRVRPSPEYSEYNTHKYTIFVDNKFETYERLLDAGIETARQYVDNFSNLEWTQNTDENFPVTDRFIQQSLSLPINAYMTDHEVQKVVEAVINTTVTPSSG